MILVRTDNKVPTSYDELARVIEVLPTLVYERRRRDQLSLRDAAFQTGLSASTISRFETGSVVLRSDNLVTLLEWVAT